MTNRKSKGKSFFLWALVVVVIGVMGVATAACSGKSDDLAPPPATIIRASDSAKPTVTAVATQPATTQPAATPVAPMTSATDVDYPLPVVTPALTSTPLTYPTP